MDEHPVWCALVQLALDVTAWLQLLALHDHPARRWEPKRPRYRLFAIPARLVTTARRTIPRHADTAPHVGLLLQALGALRTLRAPA